MVSWRSSNWKLESHGDVWMLLDFLSTPGWFWILLDCFGCLEIHCNVSFKTMGVFFSNESHPTMTKSSRKLQKKTPSDLSTQKYIPQDFFRIC